jgi:hypothetical protein
MNATAMTNIRAMPGVKPNKRFMRLDRLFNDAVRSRRKMAIVEVLLRVPLSADKARRTAEKILPTRHKA